MRQKKTPFIFFFKRKGKRKKEKGRWMGVSPIVFFKNRMAVAHCVKRNLRIATPFLFGGLSPSSTAGRFFFFYKKKKISEDFPNSEKSQLTRVTLYEALLTRFSIQRPKKKYGTARRIVWIELDFFFLTKKKKNLPQSALKTQAVFCCVNLFDVSQALASDFQMHRWTQFIARPS